ncbi:class I SAM-dependent DNA methyltransferase [Aestuariibius insulae]|uniref:class I SAM-dependent DNA methyltransferase n=1 Tax=Aestuariibius insulae TaxID=2058287 RepID=UPI00345E520E
MTEDPQTLAVYDAKAAEYAACFGPTSFQTLQDFIAALPEGGRVLDLGCGPGTASRHMAEASLKVVATDASAQMIALAGEIAGVTARQESFDDLTGTDLYDGIWASFSLLHAPRAKLPDYLAAISAALKPGGLLHLGMKLGDGERRDSLGRFYSFYSEEELRTHLDTAGFTVTSVTTGEERGLAGDVSPYILFLARG